MEKERVASSTKHVSVIGLQETLFCTMNLKHIPQKITNYKQNLCSYLKINYAECLTIRH